MRNGRLCERQHRLQRGGPVYLWISRVTSIINLRLEYILLSVSAPKQMFGLACFQTNCLLFLITFFPKNMANNTSDGIIKLEMIQMSVHFDSKARTRPCLIHSTTQQLQL